MYGRSGALRRFCESGGLAYVAVVPCDFRVTLPSGAVVRADQAAGNAVFERRSCGNGSKGPRFADWALTATASPRHYLLIRRLLSRPDDLAYYLCWAPQGTPATMTFFITIAGRRWPAETARIERLARHYTAGLITRARPSSPSTCTGPAGDAATKPGPGGTTTTPACWPRQPPDPGMAGSR